MRDHLGTSCRKNTLDFKISLLSLVLVKVLNVFFFAITTIASKKHFLKGFQLPKSFFFTTSTLHLLGLLGVFMIYRFKKMGIYLFIGHILIQLVTQRYYGGYLDTDTLFELFVFFLASVSFVPRWKAFS